MPRQIVTAADLDDQGQYLVARVPGINGMHQGLPWQDGVIGPISGYQVREFFNHAPQQVWEFDPKLEFRWTPKGPRYDTRKVLDAEQKRVDKLRATREKLAAEKAEAEASDKAKAKAKAKAAAKAKAKAKAAEAAEKAEAEAKTKAIAEAKAAEVADKAKAKADKKKPPSKPASQNPAKK